MVYVAYQEIFRIQRRKETAEKVEAAIVEYLGERVRDLISLDNLATAKRAQRRGYASALVTHLTDLVRTSGIERTVGS